MISLRALTQEKGVYAMQPTTASGNSGLRADKTTWIGTGWYKYLALTGTIRTHQRQLYCFFLKKLSNASISTPVTLV